MGPEPGKSKTCPKSYIKIPASMNKTESTDKHLSKGERSQTDRIPTTNSGTM